ncbi:MAG: hypothetical protein ACXAC8_13150 [Candidatus Hodarchaeales archaeon]
MQQSQPPRLNQEITLSHDQFKFTRLLDFLNYNGPVYSRFSSISEKPVIQKSSKITKSNAR